MRKLSVPLPFLTRLRVLLALYDLTADELARRAGIDPTQLSRVLSGERPCRPEVVAKLIVALHREELEPAVATTPPDARESA